MDKSCVCVRERGGGRGLNNTFLRPQIQLRTSKESHPYLPVERYQNETQMAENEKNHTCQSFFVNGITASLQV